MYKTLLPVLFSFLIVGCDNGVKESDFDGNFLPLVEGKPYYDENVCNDPKYTSYTIDKYKLEIKSFSDANYSELVSTKKYSVKKFEEGDIQISVNGIVYQCTVADAASGTPLVVEMFGIDCHKTYVENSDTIDIDYMAFYTKEEAHANKYVGECP